MFVIAGLVFTSGCDGHDPCSKVQNGQECNRDTECTEGNSCWCGWCILEECDGVLEFRDHSLEYSIRYQIDKPKGDIRYEDVRDLSVLRGRCDEYYCIVSLEGIQCLSSLQELYLYEHHGISDISPLSTLTGLEKVRLANNYIVDISPLSKSTLITELDISENEIVSVSPLTDLVNLEKLNISFNQITDVSSLEGMTVLQILDMSTNDIGNYGPLSGLGSLIELYANGASNGHGDISSLSSLTTLEILELRYNNITSLVPLNNLVLLNHLDLSSNEINDVSPLVDNQGISESDWVDIYDNPIDCFEQAANIQALRDRGVDLDTNCP
jgi:internalin A